VLGFVARMYCSGFLNKALFDCGTLVLLIVFSLVSYILFIFLLGNRFQVRNAFSDFKNMAPAGIIAFTSGCSLSTMPTTIEGTAKNLQDPSLANALIPATTNIQQIGDCLANSLLCFWIYQSFFCVAPSFSTWASFSFVFVLARFTTVAVLGGAIFIMLPIYKHYLNFNDDMIAIIVAFNVILDPIITSANVLANGALAKVFERCWIFLSRGKDVLPGKQ
jgi:Na+/H+-dicarboxylate symporter